MILVGIQGLSFTRWNQGIVCGHLKAPVWGGSSSGRVAGRIQFFEGGWWIEGLCAMLTVGLKSHLLSHGPFHRAPQHMAIGFHLSRKSQNYYWVSKTEASLSPSLRSDVAHWHTHWKQVPDPAHSQGQEMIQACEHQEAGIMGAIQEACYHMLYSFFYIKNK